MVSFSLCIISMVKSKLEEWYNQFDHHTQTRSSRTDSGVEQKKGGQQTDRYWLGTGSKPITTEIQKTTLKCFWGRPFPVIGQGVFIFNTEDTTPIFLSVEDVCGDNSLGLYIDLEKAYFMKRGDMEWKVLETTKSGGGLEKGRVAYWYSYDRDNLVLKYGKGYIMEETTALIHDFLKDATPENQDEVRKGMYPYFNPEQRKYVRKYGKVPSSGGLTEPEVQFVKNPFMCNLPPLILDSSKTNLFVLDNSNYVFSASLPVTCKELYDNVIHCNLNYPEDVESVLLSDAIRYSIETEECLLNRKLKDKATEFGDKTYLRITLGNSLGKSPGIPYVLEIWPKSKCSPMHNHGNANAVIKVLHGSIRVKVYNKQTKDSKDIPIKILTLYKDDVTWIDRNWYQTHQLQNVSDDYCATIQCYKYDSGDTTHWPYFDYISANKTIAEFIPNSDFGFKEMRNKVMAEYKKHKNI